MGQVKDYRWFLKHEDEFFKKYGEGWMVISDMRVVDFKAEKRKKTKFAGTASQVMIKLWDEWKDQIPAGQYIIQEVRSPKHKKYDEDHPISIRGAYTDSDNMGQFLLNVVAKMWMQGDYIHYENGKIWIDGVTEVPEENFNRLMEFLDEHYGELK